MSATIFHFPGQQFAATFATGNVQQHLASASNTYGINLVLKSNAAKKTQLTMESINAKQIVPNVVPSTIQMVVEVPTPVTEHEDSTEVSEGEANESLARRSKPISKTKKAYQICTVTGCNRSYYSEKRYKKHLMEHFTKLMKKLIVPKGSGTKCTH